MSIKSEIFKDVLARFETEHIKEYCIDMIEQIPDYIFKIPSSTSLKYHNATQCQPGGQIYHMLMVANIMNYILELDYIKKTIFPANFRDYIRCAAILHDALKCGKEQNEYSLHEHPVLTAEWVRNTKVEHDENISKNVIAELIETHSGEWRESKRSDVVLPELKTLHQFLVHLADYLGSRADLDMIYSDEIKSLVEKING